MGGVKNVSKLFGFTLLLFVCMFSWFFFFFFFFFFFLVGWIFVCNMKYVNTRTATGQELLPVIHNPCLFIFLPQKLLLYIERNNNTSMRYGILVSQSIKHRSLNIIDRCNIYICIGTQLLVVLMT